jgi:hypothetical protein
VAGTQGKGCQARGQARNKPQRFIQPIKPEVNRWKYNRGSHKSCAERPTFNMLLNKYTGRTDLSSNLRWYGKRQKSLLADENHISVHYDNASKGKAPMINDPQKRVSRHEFWERHTYQDGLKRMGI